MGDDIYEYIQKNLDNAINEASQSEFHLAAKLFLKPKLSQQFKDLKKLLEAKRDAVVAAAAAAAGAAATATTAAGVAAPAAADESTTAAVAVRESRIAADHARIAADDAAKDAAERENFLREQLYYINNILTEWQMITNKPFSISCESVTSLTNLSQSLNKIKQDLSLKKTKSDSRRGEGGSTRPTNSDPKSESNVSESDTEPRTFPTIPEEPLHQCSSRYIDEKEVHGIEDKVLSMERLLVLRRDKNDPFKAFGIDGMAGIGKTTLCQCIFSRPKVKEYFLPRIWVCVSKQKHDTREKIVKTMLMCLGLDKEIINKTDELNGLRGLIFALRLQLTGKRYLIVLDDAWSNDEWFKMMDSSNEDENSSRKKFAFGLPKGCGGTVIVTSRTKEVVKNMVGEEQNLRCLMPFKDDETCWNIFQDSVKKDVVTFPKELDDLKEEIVKRCDGLPLAAKMMGKLAADKIRQKS